MPQGAELACITNSFNFHRDARILRATCNGAFIPEILHETIAELQAAFAAARLIPPLGRVCELDGKLFLPSDATHRLDNLSQQLGGAQLYVKREDLNHTGAHKPTM